MGDEGVAWSSFQGGFRRVSGGSGLLGISLGFSGEGILGLHLDQVLEARI